VTPRSNRFAVTPDYHSCDFVTSAALSPSPGALPLSSMAETSQALTREFLAERDVRVFKMRQAGVSNQEISRRFGISVGAVGKAVNRQLEKLNAEALMAYPEVLRMELERLDSLQSAIWPLTQHRRVTLDDGTDVSVEPDMKAIGQVLSIMDRRTKLLGMEAHPQSEQNIQINVGHQENIRVSLAGAGGTGSVPVDHFNPETESKKLLELMTRSGVISKDEITASLGSPFEDILNNDLQDVVDAEIVDELTSEETAEILDGENAGT